MFNVSKIYKHIIN